jgi:hypothetical protein
MRRHRLQRIFSDERNFFYGEYTCKIVRCRSFCIFRWKPSIEGCWKKKTKKARFNAPHNLNCYNGGLAC